MSTKEKKSEKVTLKIQEKVTTYRKNKVDSEIQTKRKKNELNVFEKFLKSINGIVPDKTGKELIEEFERDTE